MSIQQQSIVVSCQEKTGRIELSDEVCEATARGVERSLEALFGYYKYKAVEVIISSPGGQLLSLRHILNCMQEWRAKGKLVLTESNFQAASAAAVLLSMGECKRSRTVLRTTQLHYHLGRIGAAPIGQITAGTAQHIATMLRHADDGLVGDMVDHNSEGFGGATAHASEGLARCQLVKTHADDLAKAFSLKPQPQRKGMAWLTSVEKAHAACLQSGSMAPFKKYLERRFGADTGMSAIEAYASMLIDGAKGVALLVSQADAQPTPKLVAVLTEDAGASHRSLHVMQSRLKCLRRSNGWDAKFPGPRAQFKT
jgi:ATP-dependent protease ClpP protease subunit